MPRLTRVRRGLADDRAGFSSYARLLEEAATVASAEAGYPPQWYGEHATAWVIRRSTIECPAPVPPGVELEILTWVADFRRVRSRREYELRLEGALVLSAHTDWVYVDRTSGRPRRIPDAMMRAFVPEGEVQAMPRAALDVADPPADAPAVEIAVDPRDVDRLDHVNNANYFDYVEAAATTAIGDGWRALRHDLEYLDEARAGDRLRCVTWALGESERATEIRRVSDRALLTKARSAWTRNADRGRER